MPAARCGIDREAVAKRKRRTSVTGVPTRPREPRPTGLSLADEAVELAFCRHTLPLDDGPYALQATRPHLTRPSLHRCPQGHGISRLPEVDGGEPGKRKFENHPIGYFHLDIARVRTEQGKRHLFGAVAGIDRRTTTSRQPRADGPVERMNRTIEDATVPRFHHDDRDQLRHHLADFVAAYDSGRRPRTLSGPLGIERVILISNDADCVAAMRHGREAGLQLAPTSVPGRPVAPELLHGAGFHRPRPGRPA